MLARINIATFRRRLKVACRCLCLRLSSSADLMSTDSLRRKTCLQRITHQRRGWEMLRNTEGIHGVEASSVSEETYTVQKYSTWWGR